MENKYIEELKNGKQIRIKYAQKNYDYCADDGWWSEELWLYDAKFNFFRCYYPVSSYDKLFFTYHTEKDAMYTFKDAVTDFMDKKVIDIVVEDIFNKSMSNSLTVKELAIEKIKSMSDEEIKEKLLS